jgi:phosphomannomutase
VRCRLAQSISFGTDGWRGVIAEDFTVANVQRVTRAIAQYLATTYPPHRPVLIGYDTRFLADQFAQVAATVLAEAGRTVWVSDRPCPTPAIAYNARHHATAGALMLTASHNPAQYCGIKYIPDYAGPATRAITDSIMAHLAPAPPDAACHPAGHGPAPTAPDAKSPVPEPTAAQPTAPILAFDPKPVYWDFLQTLVDVETLRAARLTVAYDALYSTSQGYLDEFLRHCGCGVTTLHARRDVLFGGGMPEPTAERLGELAEAVRRQGAAVGVATDGDSDRCGVLDERGEPVSGNAVLLVLLRHLVEAKGQRGAIVRTVATTHLLDQLAAQYGLPLYETPVGFKWIGERMRQEPVLIGGEESGGLSVLGHIPEKDGILASLLVVEAIAHSITHSTTHNGQPLSQLVQTAIAQAGGPRCNHRIDFPLPMAAQAEALQRVITTPPTEVAGIAVQRINNLDGVKLVLADGSWILLRPSGTEPLLRLYIEAMSEGQVGAIGEAMQNMLLH